jgi:hypothetical protein
MRPELIFATIGYQSKEMDGFIEGAVAPGEYKAAYDRREGLYRSLSPTCRGSLCTSLTSTSRCRKRLRL